MIGDGGARAEIQEDAFAFDDSRAAGIQRDFHFFGAMKRAVPMIRSAPLSL